MLAAPIYQKGGLHIDETCFCTLNKPMASCRLFLFYLDGMLVKAFLNQPGGYCHCNG